MTLDPGWGLIRWIAAALLSAVVVAAIRPGLARSQDVSPESELAAVVAKLGDKDQEVRLVAVRELPRFGAPAVPHLVALLNDRDDLVRGVAVDELGEMGAVAVPALIDALGSADEVVSYGAASVLLHMGRTAIPPLLEALRERKGKVRGLIASQLGAYGADGSAAIPLLVALLADADASVRDGAASGLRGIGTAAGPALIAALKSPDRTVREGAALALSEMVEVPTDAVAALGVALEDESAPVRRAAAKALAPLATGRGELSVSVCRKLIAGLRDADPEVVTCALGALGNPREGEEAGRVVSAITPLLRHENTQVRIDAAYALSNIGPASAPAISLLIGCLGGATEEDLGVIWAALAALESIGPPAKEAVPRMTELLADPRDVIREGAASALGAIGAPAATAIPALRKLARDKHRSVRAAAAEALASIGGSPPDELLGMLKDADAEIRARAAVALGALGPKARGAVPALVRALEDREESVKVAVACALGSIGPDASVAAPVLWAIVEKDPGGELAMRAADAVGRMGKDALPLLLKLLLSDDPTLMSRVHDAFRAMGGIAVPDLRGLLKHESEDLRAEAASALGVVGREARAAIADLSAAMDDPSERVRHVAAAALSAVGKEAVPVLIESLRDSGPVERKRLALFALALLGPEASGAVPAVKSLVDSAEPDLRAQALRVLELIEGK